METYRLLVQFSTDAHGRLLAQLLGGMKAYEVLHVRTNTILDRNNWA